MADSSVPELCVLRERTRDLELTLKDNYDMILEDLYKAGLVKSGVYSSVKDAKSMLSSAEKASSIVTSIMEVVEVQPANYQKFVEILKKNEGHYLDIIRKLKQTHCGKSTQMGGLGVVSWAICFWEREMSGVHVGMCTAIVF